MVFPINPQIRTVRDCFGVDPQPRVSSTSNVSTPETVVSPESTSPVVETSPLPVVSEPVVKTAPSPVLTQSVIRQGSVEPQRVDSGAQILDELGPVQDCDDHVSDDFEIVDFDDMESIPAPQTPEPEKSRAAFFAGTAGLNNERGNLYIQGSGLTFNQVDGKADLVDVVNAGTWLMGMGEADSVNLLNVNVEYGMMDQVTVQGGLIGVNSHTDREDAWIEGGTNQTVIGQAGVNAGFHNPDGSVGVNFGAAADAVKITNTLDDQQGGSVNYAAGIGVSLPSGHIGLSDRDKDGISELSVVGEGELGVGVAGGFTSETAGGLYDDYVAPVVQPIKDGVGSVSDTIWSYLPEI